MTASATLTVRLKPEIKEQLARLSVCTDRSRAFLAAEAIEAYVVRESERIAGIQRGLADMKAGRVIAHEAAMDELDAAIDEVARENV
jgi:predicted transcriptional regulator